MSIKLITMPLCEHCGEFTPAVTKSTVDNTGDEFPQYYTTIRCEHERRCKNIVRRGLELAQTDAL